MKVSEGLKIPGPNQNRNMFSVHLQRSLYGLKQSGRMWFNRLSKFLLKRGYTNNDDCPCVFIKKSTDRFCIISVYVNDLNIIGTTRDIEEASAYLKTEFEMKTWVKPSSVWACSSNTSMKECLYTSPPTQRGYLKSLIWTSATLPKLPWSFGPWKWIRFHSDPRKRMRRFWDLKSHT